MDVCQKSLETLFDLQTRMIRLEDKLYQDFKDKPKELKKYLKITSNIFNDVIEYDKFMLDILIKVDVP